MLDIGLTVFAYLLGSISTGVIVSKLMNLPDPRHEGSGNPGATNVLRLGGKKAAAITLAGDMLKGLIPVLIARALGAEDHILAAIGLAAFLGHLYPVFFGFHGGKGVATALGVLLGISWPVALAVIGTWLLMAKLFKISSLSAITAAVMAPVFMWRLEDSAVFMTLALVLSTLLIWRHRGNIKRLLEGSEGKIK
ncbi:MAG: glycerol-3-phosphate 1-O-acyltransferase PlsY [Gammaproteobacteria bacterium]|nr:glycerol-3-phosphate 1-O-acyltransferase PlsY [Gammaproteobacteria bacterium]